MRRGRGQCVRECACASVCASALSNVVSFSVSLSPSLSENTCVPQQQEKKSQFKCRVFILEDGNPTDRPLFVCVIVYFVKSMS